MRLPTPPETDTFKPVPHAALIEELETALEFRHTRIVRDEYAVSPDGMKLFGLLELDAEFEGVRFAIGLRNSNDKSMRLGMVAGYRVFVCDNMALSGDFRPAFHKHTKGLELTDVISIAVDKIHRHFTPLRQQIKAWQGLLLPEPDAKLIIYDAFRSKDLRLPARLMGRVHDLYFYPNYEEMREPTLWSLSNAFTSAFKELNPIPRFKTAAKLGAFLEGYDVRGVRAEKDSASALALHA